MRLLAALLGAILILVTASPADAAPSGRTVRLARTAGVDITVPPAVNLGVGFIGGTLTGQLGVVEVRDSRGPVKLALAGGWTKRTATGTVSFGAVPAAASAVDGSDEVLTGGLVTSALVVALFAVYAYRRRARFRPPVPAA
ncbi:hypothetical protein ABZ793_30410 [Micromonospora sp. NPDC047465]|uniref:hypothetical protein n=1 Tax=Micromonospora sp. NPDC047465 TaxID=3154813 RepID=UPI0034103F20